MGKYFCHVLDFFWVFCWVDMEFPMWIGSNLNYNKFTLAIQSKSLKDSWSNGLHN